MATLFSFVTFKLSTSHRPGAATRRSVEVSPPFVRHHIRKLIPVAQDRLRDIPPRQGCVEGQEGAERRPREHISRTDTGSNGTMTRAVFSTDTAAQFSKQQTKNHSSTPAYVHQPIEAPLPRRSPTPRLDKPSHQMYAAFLCTPHDTRADLFAGRYLHRLPTGSPTTYEDVCQFLYA